MQADLFSKPMPVTGELILRLEIPGRLPSWNEILGMEHWTRDKFKQKLQDAFEFALRQSANDCSIKTISAKSTMLTAAATLGSYREMVRQRRKLRQSNARQTREKKKESLLSSGKSKVPF
jgi:hypothetical protein